MTDSGGNRRIPDDARVHNPWRELLKYFQPLAAQAVIKLHKAGRISAGMREALDKSGTYGINGRHEDNGYGVGRLQQRSCSGTAGCDYNIRLPREQLSNMLADIVGLRRSAVNIKSQVLAFNPSKLAQPFPKS